MKKQDLYLFVYGQLNNHQDTIELINQLTRSMEEDSLIIEDVEDVMITRNDYQEEDNITLEKGFSNNSYINDSRVIEFDYTYRQKNGHLHSISVESCFPHRQGLSFELMTQTSLEDFLNKFDEENERLGNKLVLTTQTIKTYLNLK